MLISVCPQERERYVMKFIKIMKWLRKMNNFNSYLAILSALDSAPIRRLGSFLIWASPWSFLNISSLQNGKKRSRMVWPSIVHSSTRPPPSEPTGQQPLLLTSYCAISKEREQWSNICIWFLITTIVTTLINRLALAEATPPCIPYIGLVLQVKNRSTQSIFPISLTHQYYQHITDTNICDIESWQPLLSRTWPSFKLGIQIWLTEKSISPKDGNNSISWWAKIFWIWWWSSSSWCWWWRWWWRWWWSSWSSQDNLRRFKKEQYQLTRNEDIIGFFSEFDNYITEDEMWALRFVYHLSSIVYRLSSIIYLP